MNDLKIDSFLTTIHAYAAIMDGVLRMDFIKDSEREVKRAVFASMGLSTCDNPECDCVDNAWAGGINQDKIDIVPVVITEVKKDGRTT